MDALMILKKIELNKKKLENLDDTKAKTSKSDGIGNIGLMISIIIGVYAAYLSYECNSKKDIPEVQKIIFSVLAYIFGLFYLIYYFLFRYDTCV
jgi:hypothetical protein